MYNEDFSKPDVKLVDVTPEQAKKMLTRSSFKNRSVSGAAVRKYARDMKNGNWDIMTPNLISVTESGDILDGQHRLRAVVLAGVTVPLWIANGVDPRASIYDRGRSRSAKDILCFEGFDVTAKDVAVVRWLFRYCFSAEQITDSQIKKYLEKHCDEIRLASDLTHYRNNKSITKKAAIAASAYQALRCGVDRKKLGDFFAMVNSGIPNKEWETSPFVVRNYILEHVGRTQRDDGSLDIVVQSGIFDYVREFKRQKAYDLSKTAPYREQFIELDKEEAEKIKGESLGTSEETQM